jgi:1,4-dihydroxy-6-naphthoate synthase
VVFSGVEHAVLRGEVDAGVIIHENRFTYEEKGLFCMHDLGAFWEENYFHLLPLGGIVVKRGLPQEIKSLIDHLVRESIRYAFDHPEASAGFVKKHAQEMDEEVRQKHIALYVNDHSVDLAEEGRKAVTLLMEKSGKLNLNKLAELPIFVK